jgi:hypothetical protein
VTSEISTSWLISMSGHFTSSFWVFAKKPSLMKSFFLVDSCSMHSCEQWWFVITRPSGETTLALQPPAMRTEASRT